MINLNLKKTNKKLIILNIALVIIFFVSQIAVTSILGTKNTEVQNIRSEKAMLRTENEILTSEIDKLKSLASLKDDKTLNLKETTVNFLDEVEEFKVASN